MATGVTQEAKRYWSELEVGQALPDEVHGPLDRLALVRYAGATGRYDRRCVDEPFAQAAGLPSVQADSTLLLTWAAAAVRRFLGTSGQIQALGARFVKIVWPGDTVTVRGRIVRLHHAAGRYTAEFDLWAENQRGDLVLKGSAVVRLHHSAEDEARQARGEGPLVLEEPPPPPLEARLGAPIAGFSPASQKRSRARAKQSRTPATRRKKAPTQARSGARKSERSAGRTRAKGKERSAAARTKKKQATSKQRVAGQKTKAKSSKAASKKKKSPAGARTPKRSKKAAKKTRHGASRRRK
ncbi:MAG: hypothetical protein D6729_02600 [Deltaproteobacteria bacterium]|nr:MAG: hypothetical protein D6729_02600 [Deltaproteobacteria bacterium]